KTPPPSPPRGNNKSATIVGFAIAVPRNTIANPTIVALLLFPLGGLGGGVLESLSLSIILTVFMLFKSIAILQYPLAKIGNPRYFFGKHPDFFGETDARSKKCLSHGLTFFN